MDLPKRIMVIDDEPDLTQLIGYQFKSLGYEVKTAGDGLQALAIVHEFKPDLIILDMNMPRMGGIEFYTKICGPDGRPVYPVLVLTARANVEGLFKDFEIGGFMIKPFEIDHLVREAELIIKKRKEELAVRRPQAVGIQKVCVIEHQQPVFDQLTGLLLNAGYTVVPAKNGTVGIERVMRDVPEVAFVQLGLPDISGDTVIFRLCQMSKTMDVKFILYTSLEAEHDRQVMTRIGLKTGIVTFVEYKELKEVIGALKHV